MMTDDCAQGKHTACWRAPNRMPSGLPLAICECGCHDTRSEQKRAAAGIPCPHCQQPMLLVPCDYCDGYGGWWATDARGDWWRVCPDCHDTGQQWVCLNTFRCPGKRWYPLDARSARALAAASTTA